MSRIVIGIDPGVAGGIAWCVEGHQPAAFPMPKTERDVSDLIGKLNAHNTEVTVYLEQVHAMPGQGVTSMFTFGRGYGFLRGVLTSRAMLFIDVTPAKWQRKLGLVRKDKSETNTEKKNRHKQLAQQLYPHLKVTHMISDALLILSYARDQ